MPSTLLGACDYREDIRKSRFIALAAPIDSAVQAQAFIDQFSDLAASHNCWAWKLGDQYRSSDDGEPGGTAGRPILAAIEAQDCDRVVVLVIRWYGGIQLGTGGLARAYGGGASKCLQAGERVELVSRVSCACHCQFAELPLLKARLPELEALMESEQYDGEGAQVQIAIPEARFAELHKRLADISRGRIVLQRLQEEHCG